MTTHELKVQRSICQSGETASVPCVVVSNRERFNTHTDKTRFQNVSGHGKLHSEPSAQHIHSKKESEAAATSSPSLHITGQQKSSRDVQIRQIILLQSKKDSNKTSKDQKESARFTTVISISLLTKRNKKDTTEDTEETLPVEIDFDGAKKKTANQHHTERRDLISPTCNKSCGELLKVGDGPKAPFDEDSISTLQNQHGLNIPNQRRDTGIQHNISLYEHLQTVHSDTHKHSTEPAFEIQTEFSKCSVPNKESGASDIHRENTPTTPQYHNNLTSLGEDSGLKVLNQILSFHATHSGSTPEPEPRLINPASDMLTSALASVLSPPCSGHLRRPKQGGSELEHEPQNCGQNVNLSTLSHQDRQQQLFIATRRQPAEHVLQAPNDDDMQFTAGTSNNSPDWQKENNSPNVTTAIQSKRPILKCSSVDTYRGMMYNNTELHCSATSLHTGQVLKFPHSEESRGYKMSKTEDQNKPFKSLSSKPTTSSLLLSLRRSNLRRSNAEPRQMESQITKSVRSLTLPNRSVLKNAQSYTLSVTPDDHTGETLVSYPFLDTHSKTEGISDTNHLSFSPRIKKIVALRTPLLLNKRETDQRLKRPEGSVARAEEKPFSPSTTTSSQPGIVKAQQHSHLVLLRKYFNTENSDPVEPSTINKTKLHNPITTISPKEKTNVNLDYPQTVRNVASQSTQNIPDSNSTSMRTFTDRLNSSPSKENSPVDGNNTTIGRQIYLDSKKHSGSSQSSMDLSSPLSPSRPIRGICIPSIYSYLRESSPNVSTPNSPSTPSSHLQRVVTSSSPKQDKAIIPNGDREPLPSRFSFDLSPIEPNVEASKRGSHGTSALKTPAQSLPPDFGRRSVPRLSTSPYSTLISSRPALNSTLQALSSPPKRHDRSTSDTATVRVGRIKGDQSSSPSMYTSITRRPKEQLTPPDKEQRTENSVHAYTCALDNHRPAQPCLSQTAPVASFVLESSSPNIIPHPRLQQENDGSMALQFDKGNAYPKRRSQKETYLLSNKLTTKSQTPLIAEKETTTLHTHERLQEIQSPNSKKALFALRVKKDIVTLDPMTYKEVVPPQYLKTKRNSPVFKTSSRIDQMLNRLKMTFSVKHSESTLETVTKKSGNATQQPSHTETWGKNMTVEKLSPGIQWEPPTSSLTTDKAPCPSSESLSPVTLKKSWNIQNAVQQHRCIDDKNCSGIQWELPTSSLTTDKAPCPSSESLSPVTLKKSENSLNVNHRNRCKNDKKCYGIQWEPPNSALTTDKASFPSMESMSPLTLIQSENTLNVDQQNQCKDVKKGSGIQWESPNSALTTNKASFPSLKSLSPLTLIKSENTLNVDQQKWFKDEKKCSWSQWEHPNSSLTMDEALPYLDYMSLLKLSQKRCSDENGNQSSSSSYSPHTLKPHGMNRSASLPHYKKSSVGRSSPFYLFDFDSEDIQNENVFYSPASKQSNLLCESDNIPQLSTTKRTVQQNLMGSRLSSSSADLKYGLENGRSFSVSSVFSSRPSGPKRISTSSISDLSSLDDFGSKGSYTKSDSPINNSNSPSYGAKYVTGIQTQPGCTLSDDHFWNPDKQEISSGFWDDADPTPPPSPPFSPSSRRVSQAPANSSPIRTTPDNLSPRGILPSRSYTTNLTVFEESSSDTTTDDEYYLDDGDEEETEL
ncbi:uncharacterized protein LOC127434340 isoform X1 [Myxocyprinus asiaticus]|uniref:uncharacterized protein LOC127434340 isoform X1 n=1 Tax=Myxocyprinus asiaticus TaxID=70543 RepID=UPI00222268D2|nr:uncharacterized protein LOC127434340 isoform X1 [Myxocyprinus asiaticus]